MFKPNSTKICPHQSPFQTDLPAAIHGKRNFWYPSFLEKYYYKITMKDIVLWD